MSSKFATLCTELSQLHVHILRRAGHPILLAREGLSLVHDHISCVETNEENAHFVPLFLRCCATMLRHAQEEIHNVRGMQILDAAYTLASQHIYDNVGGVDAASGVLRAVLALNTYEQQALQSSVAWTNYTQQRQQRYECSLSMDCSSSDSPVVVDYEPTCLVNDALEPPPFPHATSNASTSSEPRHQRQSTPLHTRSAAAPPPPWAPPMPAPPSPTDGLTAIDTVCASNAMHGSPHRNDRSFATLLVPAFQVAFNKWLESRHRAQVLSVCGLLEGISEVYGAGFRFTYSHQNDMTGLLPCKSKQQMEAKVQRCAGARELLASLRDATLNRLDAAMCLSVMAHTGLYDGVLCDDSMHVLYDQHALLTSQQVTEVLYSLGVMQHRHVHQTFLSARVDPRRCTAEAVRRWVVGLAMLRQPLKEGVHGVMNGLFLHALHASRHRPQQEQQRHHLPSASSFPAGATINASVSGSRWTTSHATAARSDESHTCIEERSGSTRADSRGAHTPHALPPNWFLDCAHSLACLSVQHHKFCLMTARQCRCGGAPASLTLHQQCQLLYALGKIPESTVPHALRSVWHSQVKWIVRATIQQLHRTGSTQKRTNSRNCNSANRNDCGVSSGMTCEEGAWVMQALVHAGVTKHSCIPPTPALVSHVSPAQVMLQTWLPTSQESIVAPFTKQTIDPTPTAEHSMTLTRVLEMVANGSAEPLQPID